jgi:hypothetical protein
MKKILLCLILFIGFGANAQTNLSTGLTGLCGVDPSWYLITMPVTAAGPFNVYRSSAAATYEPQPHVPTGAYWVNQSCSHIANPIGSYTYRRDFSVPFTATVLDLKFKMAWDDNLLRVILRDPSGTIYNLTTQVFSNFTATEQLTLLNTLILPSPIPGSWQLEVETVIANNDGGMMFAGDVNFTSPCVVTSGISQVCPCATNVPLIGTPAGGVFTGLPNPFTPPVLFNQPGPVVYPYTYTVTPFGCPSQTVTGNVVVGYQVPSIISPISVSTLSATITCTPASSCNVKYKFEYSLSPIGPWCTPGAVFTPSITLSGGTGACAILPGTTYFVRVKTIYLPCNASSAYSTVGTFTTLNNPCGNGTCATIISPSAADGKVSWNTCAGSGAYSLEVRQLVPPTATISFCIPNPATLSYTLPTGSGFIAGNTTCQARIRTKCLPGCPATLADPWSIWSPWTGFTNKPSDNSFVSDPNINIFPNPTSHNLNIELNLEKNQLTTVKLFDLTGRLLKQTKAQSHSGLNIMQVDMSALSMGTYMIQVIADEQLMSINKIQKSE